MITTRLSIPRPCLIFLTAFVPAASAALTIDTPGNADCCPLNLATGAGFSLGGWLYPEVNIISAFGSSSAEEGALAVGHHDPDRNGFTVQNVELSLTGKFGSNVLAFATYAAKVDLDNHWADELEEYYMIFKGLPLDAQLKGGRFYPQFGYQQTLHPEDFVFADQYLANGRMIGEDSLALYGGELSFPVLRALPTGWKDRFNVAFGAVPEKDEEEGEDESEAPFPAEGALFHDWAATADYTLTYTPRSDTHYQFGVSGAWGDNNAGRQTQLFGLHTEYLWQPEGVMKFNSRSNTGEYVRWRSEIFLRRYGSANESGEPRDFTDFGAYSEVSYGLPGGVFQTHLRGEYVSGSDAAGLDERWRTSPSITWRPSEKIPVLFKLQYNYDHSPQFGDEHSIWAQFSLTWGDCCALTR